MLIQNSVEPSDHMSTQAVQTTATAMMSPAWCTPHACQQGACKCGASALGGRRGLDAALADVEACSVSDDGLMYPHSAPGRPQVLVIWTATRAHTLDSVDSITHAADC